MADLMARKKAKQADELAVSVQKQLNKATSEGDRIEEVGQSLVDERGNEHENLRERLASDFNYLKVGREQVEKAQRSTMSLPFGASVIDTDTPSLMETAIQGQTLVSMGNSELEDGKYYVQADPKTKVKTYRGDILKDGVSKFQPQKILTSKANFVGKISGSTVENPHLYKWQTDTSKQSLLNPNEFLVEFGPTSTQFIQGLNGATSTGNGTRVNGVSSQALFSFNLIEQIERKHGFIPATDKVQWLKDNISRLSSKWYGFGSSPSGNKATFSIWSAFRSDWWLPTSHTSSAISERAIGVSDSLNAYITNDGFAHFIAYAEASDGSTDSVIRTDFVELDVELKTSAVVLKKPIFTRVTNFEGKVSGSTVENPHIEKYGFNSNSLLPVGSSSFIEHSQTNYNNLFKLDGGLSFFPTDIEGTIAQQLFSFNLIEEVERNIGKIPAANKVQWVKSNLNFITLNWYGFGFGPSGNSATLAWYRASTNEWMYPTSHNSGSVNKLSRSFSYMSMDRDVDSNGFVHFLAHSTPASSSTRSAIYTDYVELEIELKPDAHLHHPVVPLYEITHSDYQKVLTEWSPSEVTNRYPKVRGMQHVQNPMVTVEGENLTPSFYEWNLHPDVTIKGPYEIELNAKSAWAISSVQVSVVPNTTYYLNSIGLQSGGVQKLRYRILDAKGNVVANYAYTTSGNAISIPSEGRFVQMEVTADQTGTFIFTLPMLSLGSQPKAFVPRNPSHLYAQAKLGRIGNVKDFLYQKEGNWVAREALEKDVVLDGKLDWNFQANHTGFKRLKGRGAKLVDFINDSGCIIKFNGRKLAFNTTGEGADYGNIHGAYSGVILGVPNLDSGWGESFTPTAEDVKRYFNGWKYTNGTTWQSVTGNGQTATAQQALDTKPTDYTPYKLSYVRATPKDTPVYGEGALSVQGKSQVSVSAGVILREKAEFILYSGFYYLNDTRKEASNLLKNPASAIVTLYKNGEPISFSSNANSGFYIQRDNFAFGDVRIVIEDKNIGYDPDATYEVTYLVKNRSNFSTNPYDVQASVERSIGSSLAQSVSRQSELEANIGTSKRQISLHEAQLIEILARLNAGGL